MVVVPWIPLWYFTLQAAPVPVAFPLRLTIAPDARGAPVAGEEWIDQEMSKAEELFATFGVAFVRETASPLPASLALLVTRADRDALASHASPRVINVFVVASLQDVDEAGRPRKGVHWHAPGGEHYVIVVAGSPPSVLAHELGHYFGNAHSPVPDNVMSYTRTGGPVFFDEAQGHRIEAWARRYVKTGELSPVGSP